LDHVIGFFPLPLKATCYSPTKPTLIAPWRKEKFNATGQISAAAWWVEKLGSGSRARVNFTE
jgi:hypothetical protein